MSAKDATNPLATREDVLRALASLAAPLASRLSAGGARRVLGLNASRHSDDCAGIEAFARPLWGIAPSLAGGASYDGHAAMVRGIARGFDPAHPEYWGAPCDFDQRVAESAAVSAAILIAPDAFLAPLAPSERAHVAAWLHALEALRLPDNNWLFFRVLGRLAAERLGSAFDPARMRADLDRIEQFHLGGGWYSDGPNDQRDHYVAFALHFNALLYARLESARDPQRCARLRERAALFARDYAAWFDAEGRALPLGRSLAYRFAHAAFWGALAYAEVPALPWDEVRGLWARNVRWWLGRPVLDESGLLCAGYAYPNTALCEDYMAPGSPYWAFKAFLPLALPREHPFWTAGEAPPRRECRVASQPHARLLACRAEGASHVFALCAGQWASWLPRHDAERYAKFCYSTRFGFSAGFGGRGIEAAAPDSMLALTEDGLHLRVRREAGAHEVGELHVASTWRPWPDVEIRTWLAAAPPWHARVHRIRSARALSTVEGGFAVPCDGVDREPADWRVEAGIAGAGAQDGACEIVDLEGGRRGIVIRAEAGTNLMAPRTAIPALLGAIAPGETWLACAVSATAGEACGPMPFRLSATFSGRRLEGPGLRLELPR